MLTVKVSSPGGAQNVLQQTPSGLGIVDNCCFISSPDVVECDWWVVLYGLEEEEAAICPRNHTVFVTGEPASVKTWGHDFLRQFSLIVSSQSVIQHHKVINEYQPLHYGIYKDYDFISTVAPMEKEKLISVICSNKKLTKGHRERYKFALLLKEYFDDKIDLYGRGINGFDNKWDVLSPYKYHVVLENDRCNNYITEKLADSYLAYSYPFYFGAPNVGSFYDSESYIGIDINDFDSAVSTIEQTINNKCHYEEHLPYLIQSRNQYLAKYHIFPLLNNIINNFDDGRCKDNKEYIKLYPESINCHDILSKIKFKMSEYIYR